MTMLTSAHGTARASAANTASGTARLAPEQRRLYASLGVALLAEAAIFAGALAVLGHHEAPRPPAAPPTLVSLTSAPAPVPAPAAPTPVPQPPKPVPAQPRPREARPEHREVRPAPAHAVPPPPPVATPVAPGTTHAPATAPAPAAPPPVPKPAAAPPVAGPSPSFDGALRAAIEAALHYPESARMAGIAGRTRVAFHYRDGVVSGVTVVVSSGVALLDRAALAAVRDADCPKPEPAFAGKTLSEQLWVNFNLDNQE